jgi:predicted ferric reductase
VPVSKEGAIFITTIIIFAVAVSLIAFSFAYSNPIGFSVRIFALTGFISLSTATIMTPFLKEITLLFKKPFIRIHHYFAVAGLILITLHPVTLAIQYMNPAVFIPNLNSLYLFLFFGGRQALIIIYIAIAAVLLRRKIVAYWRIFHALMYVALFFGIIHATLSGTDFQNPIILLVYYVLFAAAIGAFIIKRVQLYRMKQKKIQAAKQRKQQ